MCQVCIISTSEDCPFCLSTGDDETYHENLGLVKCRENWNRLTAPGSTIINPPAQSPDCANRLPMSQQGILPFLGVALEASRDGAVHHIGNPGDPLREYQHPELPCLAHAMFLEAMDRQIEEEQAALADGYTYNKTYHPIVPVVVSSCVSGSEHWQGGAHYETHGRISSMGRTRSGFTFDAAIYRPWQDSYAPHLPNVPSSPLLDTHYAEQASQFLHFRAIDNDYNPYNHTLGFCPFLSFIPRAGPPDIRTTRLPFDSHVYNTWVPISRHPETAWREIFGMRRFSPIAQTSWSYANIWYEQTMESGMWPPEITLNPDGFSDKSSVGSISELTPEHFLPMVVSWRDDEEHILPNFTSWRGDEEAGDEEAGGCYLVGTGSSIHTPGFSSSSEGEKSHRSEPVDNGSPVHGNHYFP
ncbi:hypothetical protein BD410DRAFT_808711 [Rickenella mellea]|uniref:Uncharacterized protein n=1 Tax=Rickenella mellea TaxID=50990 RepID=A0A4Y7PJQ8_9AGAM|nr:hypothetical protein BD410DRAFT_808711 [Rickenella mellea]